MPTYQKPEQGYQKPKAGRPPGRCWNRENDYQQLDTLPTMLSLTLAQREWLRRGAESMSSVVRRLIDEAMEKET